jgi:hypothetical protein
MTADRRGHLNSMLCEELSLDSHNFHRTHTCGTHPLHIFEPPGPHQRSSAKRPSFDFDAKCDIVSITAPWRPPLAVCLEATPTTLRAVT